MKEVMGACSKTQNQGNNTEADRNRVEILKQKKQLPIIQTLQWVNVQFSTGYIGYLLRLFECQQSFR